MESEIHAKFKDRNVIVVGVGVGAGKSGLKAWKEKHKLTYALADDTKSFRLFAGQDGSIPRNVVIGPDRKVVLNALGANVPAIVKAIEDVLARGKTTDAPVAPSKP